MITLILSTARPEAGLKTLLNSLKKQTLEHSLIEFILVDKAYDQRKTNYLEIMKQFNSDFSGTMKYIKDTTPKGYVSISSARNLGVEAATNNWIVSIDDRTILYPDTLEKHHSYFEKGFDAIAGFSDFHHKDEFQISEPDKTDERYDVPGAGHGRFAGQHFYGYHMAFTKKVWQKVGGFDETFDGTYGWEDIDFGIRIYNAGAVIRLAPECKVLQVRDSAHHNTFDDRKVPSTVDSGHIRWLNDKRHRLTLMNRGRMKW